jgi:hypothetical protein
MTLLSLTPTALDIPQPRLVTGGRKRKQEGFSVPPAGSGSPVTYGNLTISQPFTTSNLSTFYNASTAVPSSSRRRRDTSFLRYTLRALTALQ